MRVIAELPEELARLIFSSATRVIVLVEGRDDCGVLREWFEEQRPELEFCDTGGKAHLQPLLNLAIQYSSLKRVFAISDRDFCTDDEVTASYADGSHLFFLRRYALENYLLEPAPLRQIFKIQEPSRFSDEAVVTNRLLDLCRKVKSLMAANWLLWEENRLAYSEGASLGHLSFFGSLGIAVGCPKI